MGSLVPLVLVHFPSVCLSILHRDLKKKTISPYRLNRLFGFNGSGAVTCRDSELSPTTKVIDRSGISDALTSLNEHLRGSDY